MQFDSNFGYLNSVKLNFSLKEEYFCKGFWYNNTCYYNNQTLFLGDKNYTFSNGTMVELKQENVDKYKLIKEENKIGHIPERKKFSFWNLFKR